MTPEDRLPLPYDDEFEDVRNIQAELYSQCWGYDAVQVRQWVLQRKEDDPWVFEHAPRIYQRYSKLLRYVTRQIHEDIETHKYQTFENSLISVAASIERNWEQEHTNPDWRANHISTINSLLDSFFPGKR